MSLTVDCIVCIKIYTLCQSGDAGSSLGAPALYYHKTTGKKVNWQGSYLGYNINGDCPRKVSKSMRKGEILGVANGKEFGPVH